MENQEKTRVAIYCRVATDTDEGRSLQAQKERLRDYAEQQGYKIVAEIAEVGSGLSLHRPGIRELNGLAFCHAMDEVLTLNISRIGRNTVDVFQLADNMKKCGVSIRTKEGSLPCCFNMELLKNMYK